MLDETVAFLAAPLLAADEHDRFFAPGDRRREPEPCSSTAPGRSTTASPLGSHGLPLMGTGDWNDGMSRIGEGGRGESVWLGWFLHAALMAYRAAGRGARRPRGQRPGAQPRRRCEPALEAAWDGEWYLRAYYDDGTPLGSHADAECRIDSIAQSWAVLSGVAPPERAARAMASVSRELVRPDDGLVLVLAPPFDRTALDPGYIKGYPPGMRENGGQYTHAAAWAVLAFAALGDGDQACDAVRDAQPDQPRAHAGRRRPLQGGAVRRRGGRLFAAAPCRPRRLVLVHGLGRVDAAGGGRGHPRHPHPRAARCTSSPASRATGRASRRRSPGGPPATASWSRTPAVPAGASPRSGWTAPACRPAFRSRSSMTARTHIVEIALA